MKTTWFKRIGWFYVPVSAAGAVVLVLALLFCGNVFYAVDRHSHSVSDTLYGIFPYFCCTFLLWNWVAANTSGQGACREKACESGPGLSSGSGRET